MLTGVRPETYDKLQLNAGILLKDLDYASATDSASLATLIATAKSSGTGILGATRGGGTFTLTPTMRFIEADGVRNKFKGGTVCDGWDVKLSATLLEITGDNLKAAIPGASAVTSGNKTTITIARGFGDDAYIDNIIWVGDTSAGLMLIDLKNALNTKGFSLTFADKGEGTIPVEFEAHCDSVSSENLPVTIILLTKAAVQNGGT